MKKLLKSLLALTIASVLALSASSVAFAQPANSVDYIARESELLFGDANLDGIVNIKDATDIQKLVAKLKPAEEISKLLADVNEDSVVNIKDATETQKWIAKLPSNEKIGVLIYAEPEATFATEAPSETVSTSAAVPEVTALPEDSEAVPSATFIIVTAATEAASSDMAATDPAETTAVSSTASSDDQQDVTQPVQSSAATDPKEETSESEATTSLPLSESTDNTEHNTTASSTVSENTGIEASSSTSAEEEDPDAEPYRKEIMDIFTQRGYDPYESGMFYSVIYNYYSEPSSDTPDYLLVWASIGVVAEEWFEITIGNYVLTCPGHCYPYIPGYFIYNPAENTLITIEEAYRSRLDGLEKVFEEAYVFRSVEVDFKVISEARVDYYGSEETELYLLHHKSCEEEVIAKLNSDFFDVPELDLPADENGFYYDKIYVASFNLVGGSNAWQYINSITVEYDTLTIYRTIVQPENQTPDMNYQFMLIELDASLLYSISELQNVTEYR